jgi:hypothetical protein
MDFQFQMDENVSTTALIAETQFPFLMRDALRKLGNEIKKSVKDEFNTRRTGYFNHPATTAYKASKGFSTGVLEETGALKNAVTTWNENEIETPRIGNDYILRVSWTLPVAGIRGAFGIARKNPAYVYLWAHEGGTEEIIPNVIARRTKGDYTLIKANNPWGLEQRDFFTDGIRKGIDKGSELASAEIYSATDLQTISKRAPYVSTVNFRMAKPPGMGGIIPQLYPTSLSGLIWYVVPPSQLYAIIGAASDIAGFLKGSFFSFGMAGGYARQVAWGQVGITKKIFRRKIRGRIWYGD